jgi:hypothetical protein
MSRPYKQLIQSSANPVRARSLEDGLKAISLGTIAFALAMLAFRAIFS